MRFVGAAIILTSAVCGTLIIEYLIGVTAMLTFLAGLTIGVVTALWSVDNHEL